MPDGDAAVQAFPFNVPGMLAGLFLAGLGVFLVGSITSGAVTRFVGFILFIVGTIVFAL
jgi:hypothetical protein